MDMQTRFALLKDLENSLERHDDGTCSYKEKFLNDTVIAKRYKMNPHSLGNVRRTVFGTLRSEAAKNRNGGAHELAELVAKLENFERRLERCERVADKQFSDKFEPQRDPPLIGTWSNKPNGLCGND